MAELFVCASSLLDIVQKCLYLDNGNANVDAESLGEGIMGPKECELWIGWPTRDVLSLSEHARHPP